MEVGEEMSVNQNREKEKEIEGEIREGDKGSSEVDTNSLTPKSRRVGLVREDILVDLGSEKEVGKERKQTEMSITSNIKGNKEKVGDNITNINTQMEREIDEFLGKKLTNEEQRRKELSVRKKEYTPNREIDRGSKGDDELEGNATQKLGRILRDQRKQETKQEVYKDRKGNRDEEEKKEKRTECQKKGPLSK